MFNEIQMGYGIDIHNLERGIGPVSYRNANIKYFHETALFRGILSGCTWTVKMMILITKC